MLPSASMPDGLPAERDRPFGHPRDPTDIPEFAEELPEDFDWKAYTDYYQLGMSDPVAAAQHYASQRKPKLHRRIRLVATYTTGGGLCNQVINHIAHFMVPSYLGGELVLAEGMVRNGTYADLFSKTWPDGWSYVPFDSVFDGQYVQEYLAGSSTIVHQVTSTVCLFYTAPLSNSVDARQISSISNLL